MKRTVIRAAMEAHLAALGFGKGTYEWLNTTGELLLIVNGTMRRVKLKAGMSQRALTFEMGRITGWSEILGIKPKLNGTGVARAADPQLAPAISAGA